MTVIQGEIDIARVSPYHFVQGQLPVLTAWFQPRRPTAVTQMRGGGDSKSVSYPVDDVENDMRRGQKEGSVVWLLGSAGCNLGIMAGCTFLEGQRIAGMR